MSVENVKAFFKKLETDEVFRDEFTKSEMLKKDNKESILKAAEANGYPFTMNDLKQAQEEMKDIELSEDELEKVAGGAGFGICLLVGYGTWLVRKGLDTHAEHWSGGTQGICLGIGIN